MHAEKCPVCEGSGQVLLNIYNSAGVVYKICHGCIGVGWVTVKDVIDKETP